MEAIKVTEVTTKETSQGGKIFVTKGKVILIKTHEHPLDKEMYCNEDGMLFICYSNEENRKNGWPGKEIYRVLPIIVSDTEKIKPGDKYYHEPSGNIRTADVDSHDQTGNYKVLALHSNFTQKQFQVIIDEKINDGDNVLVECEFNDHIRRKHIDAVGVGQNPETVIASIPKEYIGYYTKRTLTLHKSEVDWDDLFNAIPTDMSKGCIKCEKLMLWLKENYRTPEKKVKRPL